jgi:uncharacterized LabA/DUF88 family protein
MTHKLIGFADGENLAFRYQDMVKKGAKPKPDVIHIPDLLVWHPGITESYVSDIVRISYYQTCCGDDPKVALAMHQIKATSYTYTTDNGSEDDTSGSLVPRVFKKEKKTAKTKSVDINLTVDMLRYATNPQFDVLLLLSGDGDYLPLVEEVSRYGKQVWLAAFSDGLNNAMKLVADEFIDLDELFFEKSEKAG